MSQRKTVGALLANVIKSEEDESMTSPQSLGDGNGGMKDYLG